MSRPLDLIWYRPCGCDAGCELYLHADWEGPDPGGGDPSVLRWLDPAKRLTDAELAAEYQFSRLDSRVRMARVENYSGDKVLFDHYERGLDQEATLERFATHPHYDEADQ